MNGRRIAGATRLDVGDRILIGTSIMKLIASTALEPSLEEARRRAETIAKTSGQRISGVIDETPLPDLLQMFSTSSRTGVLVVHSGADVGKIHLRKGALYFAAINDDITMDPRKALFWMLAWSSGTFEFEPDSEATVAIEIQEPTAVLITEGLHQLDEFRDLQKQLPPLLSSLAARPQAGSLAELTAPEREALELILSHGQLEKVLEKFPGSHVEAARNIVSLMTREHVIVSTGSARV